VIWAVEEAYRMGVLLLDFLEEAWILADVAYAFEVVLAGVAYEVGSWALGEIAESMGGLFAFGASDDLLIFVG
jgi:hypothetical protein